jgi:hypothetical protein
MDAHTLGLDFELNLEFVSEKGRFQMTDPGFIDRKETGGALFLVIEQSAGVSPSHPGFLTKTQVIAMMNNPHLIGFIILNTVLICEHNSLG